MQLGKHIEIAATRPLAAITQTWFGIDLHYTCPNSAMFPRFDDNLPCSDPGYVQHDLS